MIVFRLWRGVSLIDGEYITIIEDVKNGLFCEVFYDEEREKRYLDEAIPMCKKVSKLRFVVRHGFTTKQNILVGADAELVATFYEGREDD